MSVVSPSSSKPDDDEYFEEEDEDYLKEVDPDGESIDDSQESLPPAHREYEKVLRQLEAECRTHIKCE